MKKLLLILMLTVSFAFSQRVITEPRVQGWDTVFDGVTITSADTSSAITIASSTGNKILWFKIGTVDSIKSDVTVKMQLYNKETGGYGDYLSGNSLTTISSSKITAGNEFYLKLTDYDTWAWADKVRFIVSVSATSSFVLTVYIGGQ